MGVAITFRRRGVRVRVTDGQSKGAVGTTTGVHRKAELGHLIGVDLDGLRARMVREDWLEMENDDHASCRAMVTTAHNAAIEEAAKIAIAAVRTGSIGAELGGRIRALRATHAGDLARDDAAATLLDRLNDALGWSRVSEERALVEVRRLRAEHDQHHMRIGDALGDAFIDSLRRRRDAAVAKHDNGVASLINAVRAWRRRPTRDGLDEIERAIDSITDDGCDHEPAHGRSSMVHREFHEAMLAREREECAKLCDDYDGEEREAGLACEIVGMQIRARGSKR